MQHHQLQVVGYPYYNPSAKKFPTGFIRGALMHVDVAVSCEDLSGSTALSGTSARLLTFGSGFPTRRRGFRDTARTPSSYADIPSPLLYASTNTDCKMKIGFNTLTTGTTLILPH